MAFAIVSKPTVALQQRLTGPVRRRASVLCRAAAQPINPDIKKEEAKVVDMVSSADITGKGVYCRCWRSATFPLCNGSHVKWNKETGDNVGPLIISVSKE